MTPMTQISSLQFSQCADIVDLRHPTMPSSDPAEPQPLRAIRSLLLAVLTIGLIGTAVDLFLLGHYEEVWQAVPLGLIALALALVAALIVRTSAAAIIALQIAMTVFIGAGVIGIALHYSGNQEFQHELDPSLSGWPLFTAVITAKAPPARAPASMVQLGLIGLIFTYRHPALSQSRDYT
jgi:hypothetical protein